MQPLVIAWLITSTAGVAALLYLWCRSLRREKAASSQVLGGALLVAAWVHPVPQQLLAWQPTSELETELEGYIGAPLEQVIAKFGEPRSGRAGRMYYTAKPWYAPFAPADQPVVHVICFEPGVVGHVYFDD